MHANPTPAHIPEQTPTVEELRLDVAWEARHGIADRIYCRLCAALLVSLYDHIPRHGWTIERYQAEYPSAPLRSVEYRNRQTQSEAARLKADPEAKKKARERTIRWRENQPEAYKAAVARSWAKPETRQKSYANKKKNRELIRAKLAEAERILAQPAQQTTNKKVRPLSKETAARITAYACLSIQNVSNWDKGPLMYPKQNIRDNAYKSVVEFAKPRRYKAKTDAERRRIELLSAVERQSELRAALSTIKAAT
jgi:hypothetical protein